MFTPKDDAWEAVTRAAALVQDASAVRICSRWWALWEAILSISPPHILQRPELALRYTTIECPRDRQTQPLSPPSGRGDDDSPMEEAPREETWFQCEGKGV